MPSASYETTYIYWVAPTILLYQIWYETKNPIQPDGLIKKDMLKVNVNGKRV